MQNAVDADALEGLKQTTLKIIVAKEQIAHL